MRSLLLALVLQAGQAELELRPVRDFDGEAEIGTFSPDGKRVLVRHRDSDTFSVLDSEKGSVVFSVEAKEAWNDFNDSYFRPECFSPDNAKVLIPSRGEAQVGDQWGKALLLIAEADKKPVPIRPERSCTWFGAWSTDGKHVYYIDGGHRKELGYSIRRWSIEAGKSEALHEKKDRLACGLHRSPDGAKLAYYDFPGDNAQVRIVVLALKDGKVQESAPFPVDDAGADGIRSLHWEPDGKSIVFSRSPDSARSPGQRERSEAWRFDLDSGHASPLVEGKTVDCIILGRADKDRWFTATRSPRGEVYGLVDRKGNRTEFPRGKIGLAASGDHWLMLETTGRSGKLMLVRPVWILK